MHKQTSPCSTNKLKVKFWSKNKMATTAYNRYEVFMCDGDEDKAGVILSEWIL
mgnify:CR=1 FL=1